MWGRLFFGQALLRGLLALAIFSYPILVIAQDVAAVDRARFHAVHQRVDKNISGHVSAVAPSGTLEPVLAKIYFVRNGKIATSARSDEWGSFQATGLEPGVYSVIAVSRAGFGVLSVVIRPLEEITAKGQPSVFPASFSSQTSPSLDVTLIPAEEFTLLAELLAEELDNLGEAPPDASAAGGGGGGGGYGGSGGGGLGTLLGAGGLAAGIVALATHTRHQASPFTP